MQNGFQLPGSRDGDDVAKVGIEDMLNLNELVDIFGIRINVTPIEFKTDSRKEADGSFGDELDFGNANWLQLFTAGTIFKDVSIFIETEITEEDIHTSWFTLGFHNLAGMGSLANVRVGRLSALEWHTLSGRLRQLPAIKNQVISRYPTSNGDGDDSVNIAAAYPSLEYYGYTDYAVWAVGVQNGKHSNDVNDEKNFFATLKVYLAQEGPLAGSAVSVAGLAGTDTSVPEVADPADPGSTIAGSQEAENEFWRVSPGVNIRLHENTDIQVGYFVGTDDNWNLSLDSPEEVDFDAVSAVVGHWINKVWWVGAQYDKIDSDDDSRDFEKATLSIFATPRENLRAGLYGRVDLDDVGEDVHEAFVNIRAMF